MEKLGFIGMGNMGGALADGTIRAGVIDKEQVYAFAPHQDRLKERARRIGFHPVAALHDLVEICDTLVMACKPHQVEEVLLEIGDQLKGKALLSIAAGWDFARYDRHLSSRVRIQCIMPNTPAMVGEGVFLLEETHSLEDEERDAVIRMLSAIGMVQELPSAQMGIGGAIAGCGPAFVDLLMEAYADAAVKYGVRREVAYALVAKTVLGAAKLQIATGEHPGVLKDQVTSPGGTTIRGVAALEEHGLRSACIKSIDVIME